MASLRLLLTERLILEELRTLCADLRVDFDDLPGEGKGAKVRQLIQYLERRHDLERLKSWLQQHRPDIEFPSDASLAFLSSSLDVRNTLVAAFHEASAELRAYPHQIAGIHLERAEVAQIVEWIHQADPTEQLGMLLDQPGGGKTVVMRDVLVQLEAAGVAALAIKADFLSGIKTRDDLAARLGLPAPVEESVRQLSAESPVVILLDQLDALSLALSRDQATLDVMLSMLARLRGYEHVRIVASCLTFDLNNDPHLSRVNTDRTFQLQPLDEAEVNRVLQAVSVNPARLLPAHRTLLATPLHLDIYAKIVADEPARRTESFRTLQELYEALWLKRIESVPPDQPAPAARIAAIYRLVDYMQDRLQLTAPVAVLDEHVEAAGYLERANFMRREKSNWLFMHQTLFDYCYARRFVAQGRSLSREILIGSQGLFDRSQMVQVLAYLRGSDPTGYRRELTDLLFAEKLRTHLRLLLIGWFGSLSNHSADELRLARRMIQDVDDRARFLQAVGGNAAWFDALNNNVLPALLPTDDEEGVDVIIRYLGTLIEQRTSQVLAHLRPHRDQSEAWDARIAFCLSRIEDWRDDDALIMLCDLLTRGRTGQWGNHCLYHLARSNPAAGCRALRAYLNHRLDNLLEQERAKRQSIAEDPNAAYRDDLPDRLSWGRILFGGLGIRELIDRAAEAAPEQFLEQLLPWFERTALELADRQRDDAYPTDSLFAWGWYGNRISEGPAFARRMAEALRHLAVTQPAEFRALATELGAVESLAVQRILAEAYLANPGLYADDIFRYLTTDNRRLNIGETLESPDYDSCRLYGAVFPHLDEGGRIALERLILDLQPAWEQQDTGHRGITQLRFLKSIPSELLSEAAQRKLQELERKFPGFELQPPQGIRTGSVGPPIEQAAQVNMSDAAWLGAMRKYDDSTTWGGPREDHFKGGVIELSRAFTEQVKSDPQRFYRLAKRFDDTISLHYVQAAISGLAESDAPVEWVYDLVRRFAPHTEGEFRKGICRALEKRAEAGIPDDLLDFMADWALHDSDPAKELWLVSAGSRDQLYYGGDPLTHGINTVRGAALQAVCYCALGRKPAQVERAFGLLGEAANDPSTAVRACVVERLGMLIRYDAERTIAIFEQALDGHPELLQISFVHNYLYWLYERFFPRIRPSIEAMLNDADEATRQAGARLTCLAAFNYAEATVLVDQAMQGDVAMRRGAAQAYAHNLGQQGVQAVCQERLLQLMHDPDDQVRAHVGECFEHLHPEQLHRSRALIEAFLASPALPLGARNLINYLKPLAVDEPELALNTTARLLDAIGKEIVDIQNSEALLEEDLAWLPLSVYTHTDDQEMKSCAMDVFERLLLLGSWTAQQALADWDRR